MKRKQADDSPENPHQQLEQFFTLFCKDVDVFPKAAKMIPQGFAAITHPSQGCLATTDVQSCIAVVFYNPGKERTGLLHLDAGTTEAAFQRFFEALEFENVVYYAVIGANMANEDFFSDMYDGSLLSLDSRVTSLQFPSIACEKQASGGNEFLTYTEILYGAFEKAVRDECDIDENEVLTQEDLLAYAQADCPATFNILRLGQLFKSLMTLYPKLSWHNVCSMIHHNEYHDYETIIVDPDEMRILWRRFPSCVVNTDQYLQYFARDNSLCKTVLMQESAGQAQLTLRPLPKEPTSYCHHIRMRVMLLRAAITWVASDKRLESSESAIGGGGFFKEKRSRIGDEITQHEKIPALSANH